MALRAAAMADTHEANPVFRAGGSPDEYMQAAPRVQQDGSERRNSFGIRKADAIVRGSEGDRVKCILRNRRHRRGR